ncbi:hypothetical protein K435DRAFT_879900 [Dendrothele bispora CBS 962.96]|uniref:Uncharacterized protein n=1 Tax=Dendrothele bispora (strain CBS 962.96) TaxID=1314807 RepID=A0A4S8KKG8_DENBC|nr:hypothetical protein K435DRAFT_879900 [Dendrothele bispora CBS 962.96]
MPDPDLKGRVKGQGFEIFGGPGPTWFGPVWPSCWYTVPFQAATKIFLFGGVHDD